MSKIYPDFWFEIVIGPVHGPDFGSEIGYKNVEKLGPEQKFFVILPGPDSGFPKFWIVDCRTMDLSDIRTGPIFSDFYILDQRQFLTKYRTGPTSNLDQNPNRTK